MWKAGGFSCLNAQLTCVEKLVGPTAGTCLPTESARGVLQLPFCLVSVPADNQCFETSGFGAHRV